jgi:D-lactate dehydrogenase
MRRVMAQQLQLYEPVEFIHAFLVERLQLRRKKQPIALHLTCSTRKMGLSGLLAKVGALCAEDVILPPEVNCCGFAGDKGFALPALNNHGLRRAVDAVHRHGAVAGYSNSRTCETGCAARIGIPYMSIMYLVEEVSRVKENPLHRG